MEQATFRSKVCLSQIFYPVDYRSADGESDAVIVWFSNASDSWDIVLRENVLRQI